MLSIPGNFQLPPGSKLTISRPGQSNSARTYKMILDAGQVMTVEARSSDLGIPQIPTASSVVASPSTHRSTASTCSPRPLSPTKPSTKRVAVVPPGSPSTPRHAKKKAVFPSPTKFSQPIVLSEMSDLEDGGKDDSENEYWKSFGEIDENLIPVAQHLVYQYRGFARLAHPDELSWDGSRGNSSIYVITRGRRVGLFADWSVVEDLTSNVPDSFYKKCASVDEAMNLYTSSYNGVPGYKKIEVLNAKQPLENPVVDDWKKPLKGLDVDILVEDGEFRLFTVVATKNKTSIRECYGPTPSQVISPKGGN
ncbi:hypothetical protein VKT23_013795 [Stygiomarasmius scandens]|uniref:Ribonuclease H1 N-terminal domain-containing protein n=1 Tax=Marasmiellus scandens TaxID=2682957 RepID=A0ABR1J346_9AGAR